MNRARQLAAAWFLASWLPAPALAASDAADSAYSAYRIPRHRWSQWTATFAGRADRSDFTGFEEQRDRSGQLQGELRTRLTGGFDSEPLFQNWSLSLSAFGATEHSESEQALAPVVRRTELTRRTLSEGISGSYFVRAYPWEFPLGFGAGTSHSLSWLRLTSSDLYEQRDPDFRLVEVFTDALDRWRWFGSASLEVGLGRVRDVTPVYEAQVLEDRLLASGALVHALSRASRERLAALFAVRGDMQYAHERPDKYFWEELERVLIEDGALERGSLSLYNAHRILEPVSIRGRILRFKGWFVGPFVRPTIMQSNDSWESSYNREFYAADTLYDSFAARSEYDRYMRDDRIFSGFGIEYYLPAGPNWQFDVFQTTYIQESGENLESRSSAFAVWTVSDRWLATGRVTHELMWEGPRGDRSPGPWTVRYGADLSYFLEDRWALTLSALEIQQHEDDRFSRSGSYSVGISYVISGLFEAPGLTAQMRPIPGGR